MKYRIRSYSDQVYILDGINFRIDLSPVFMMVPQVF